MDMEKYAQALEDLEAGRNLEEAIRLVYSTSITDEAQFQRMLAHYQTEAERKKRQAGELDHPVLGRLVRTDWSGLLTFREFAYLRQFGKPDARAQDGKPFIEHLDETERRLVEDWKKPSAALVAVCRNGPIYTSLRYLGVFEMDVDVPDDGFPTPAQEAAYRYFLDHEQQVCEAVIDALIRYYTFARQTMPDAFDYLDADERPDNPSVSEFARLCPFDSMSICRGAANGLSPLLLSWSPIWDEEHGLGTVVFRDRVIMIGPDVSDFLADDPRGFLEQNEEYGWGKAQMTESEKDALTAFVAGYEPERSDDE